MHSVAVSRRGEKLGPDGARDSAAMKAAIEGWEAAWQLSFEDEDDPTILPNVIDVAYSKEASRRCWINSIFLELFSRFFPLNNTFLPHD